MNKKDFSESDIKAKFITPAILKADWDEKTQLGREIFFDALKDEVVPLQSLNGLRDAAQHYSLEIPEQHLYFQAQPFSIQIS